MINNASNLEQIANHFLSGEDKNNRPAFVKAVQGAIESWQNGDSLAVSLAEQIALDVYDKGLFDK